METGVGFINLDDSVKIALNIALAVARENANECYTPSHLLKALLHKDVGLRDFIISIGKDLGYLEEWADVYIEQCPKSTQLSEIKPSERIDAVFRAATMHESSSGCSTSIPSVCYWHWQSPVSLFPATSSGLSPFWKRISIPYI